MGSSGPEIAKAWWNGDHFGSASTSESLAILAARIDAALREARAEALEEAARVIEVDFAQGIQAAVATTPTGDLPMVYERYLSRLMAGAQRAGTTMAESLRARAEEARRV